jgi:hypothetical protein
MRRSTLGLLVGFTIMLASAAPASAAPGSAVRDSDVDHGGGTGDDLPMIAGSRGGAEVFWWSAKRVESALPIIPFAQFELSPDLVLDFHIPVSLIINAQLVVRDKPLLSLGNPTVGLTYVTTTGGMTWFVGGRLSAPLASASDEPTWLFSNFLSAAAMTLYDLHYWAYKYLPIGGRGGFEYQANHGIIFRGELDPTLYAALDSKAGFAGTATRKTELFYQLRVEMEGRADSGWGGGAGLQVVHLLTEGDALGGNGDNAQGAFEPFVSYDSSGTFGRLGCLIALDTPLGLGFDKGKVAALHLTLGSHF